MIVSDFFDPSAKSNDWQRPALAALPAIRNDLMKWNELPPDSTNPCCTRRILRRDNFR